jgi:hypothetical protein
VVVVELAQAKQLLATIGFLSHSILAKIVSVNDMQIALFTLGGFILLAILSGIAVNRICQKEGYNPPSALVGEDRIRFFLFVNEVRKKTDNVALKRLILLYNSACFAVFLLVGLIVVLYALQ